MRAHACCMTASMTTYMIRAFLFFLFFLNKSKKLNIEEKGPCHCAETQVAAHVAAEQAKKFEFLSVW